MTPEQEALLREADKWRHDPSLGTHWAGCHAEHPRCMIYMLARELRAALADSARLDWIEANKAVIERRGTLREAIDAALASRGQPPTAWDLAHLDKSGGGVQVGPAPATPDWAEQQAAEIYQKHGSQQCPYCGAKDWSVTFGLAQHLRTSHVPATPESGIVAEFKRARERIASLEAEVARLTKTDAEEYLAADRYARKLEAELARAKPVIAAARAWCGNGPEEWWAPEARRLGESIRALDKETK